MIDMSQLNNVRVDPVNRIARAEPGLTCGETRINNLGWAVSAVTSPNLSADHRAWRSEPYKQERNRFPHLDSQYDLAIVLMWPCSESVCVN